MTTCKSIAGPKMKTNVKIDKILPIKGERYDKSGTLVRDMKTIGMEMNAEQAQTLAIQLLTAVQVVQSEGGRIRLTGHRKNRHVTTLILKTTYV